MYQNIKPGWAAHCLVIISHGWSPLSITQLCLICLGRCWRGTQERWMLSCLVAREIWQRDSLQQLHFSTPPALLFFFLHVNGRNSPCLPELSKIPTPYANERDYAPGWRMRRKIKTALTPFFALPFGELEKHFRWRLASNLFNRYVIRKQTSYWYERFKRASQPQY